MTGLILLISTSLIWGQKKKKSITTTTIEVSGVCEMCQKRIQEAAYLPGVKRADWEISTHDLTVIYRNDKVSLSAIKESIAKAGHDTEGVRSSLEAYNQLPECCAYREHKKP